MDPAFWVNLSVAIGTLAVALTSAWGLFHARSERRLEREREVAELVYNAVAKDLNRWLREYPPYMPGPMTAWTKLRNTRDPIAYRVPADLQRDLDELQEKLRALSLAGSSFSPEANRVFGDWIRDEYADRITPVTIEGPKPLGGHLNWPALVASEASLQEYLQWQPPGAEGSSTARLLVRPLDNSKTPPPTGPFQDRIDAIVNDIRGQPEGANAIRLAKECRAAALRLYSRVHALEQRILSKT